MRLIFAQAQYGLLSSLLHTFAVLGLGLSWMLVIWDLSSRGQESDAFRFWLRVFALTAYCALSLGLMAMVQTGLVLPLAVERMGNVLGPLLLAIVLTAFVIKSTVFGVVLYSRHRVRPVMFRLALLMTAIGFTAVVTGLSVMESWLRAPAGAGLIDGQFRVYDWLGAIANPQLSMQAMLVAVTTVLMLSSVLASVWALQTRSETDINLPSPVVRLFVWLGLLCTLAVLPLSQQIIELSTGNAAAMVNVLAGEVVATPYQLAMTQFARALLLFWPVHLLVLIVTLSQMTSSSLAREPGELASRVILLGSVTGPMTCFLLWWILYLGKGPDMVLGELPFVDLVTNVAPQYLLFGTILCFAMALMVVGGWMRLTYQALSFGVMTVHRPRVLA